MEYAINTKELESVFIIIRSYNSDFLSDLFDYRIPRKRMPEEEVRYLFILPINFKHHS
jgi:hypothetical protein